MRQDDAETPTEQLGGASPGRLLAGPIAGLLLAAAVLSASFAIGKLDWTAFAKGLVVVLVSAGVGVAAVALLGIQRFGAVAETHVAEVVAKLDARIAQVVVKLDARVVQVVTALETAAEQATRDVADSTIRLERSLERRVEEAIRAPDFDDDALVAVEGSRLTTAVVICRRQMADEFETDEPAARLFATTVEHNLGRGVVYRWCTEDNPVSRSRDRSLRERLRDHQDLISSRLLGADDWLKMPFSAMEVVFIVQRGDSGPRRIRAFADVSLGAVASRPWREIGSELRDAWADLVELDGIASTHGSMPAET